MNQVAPGLKDTRGQVFIQDSMLPLLTWKGNQTVISYQVGNGVKDFGTYKLN